MVVRRISDTIDKWVGLSTDQKPSGAPVGSYFVTQDNDDVFVMGKSSWGLLGGGGGGNPFSEPVQILVNGNNAAPALAMGVDGDTGFAIQPVDYGGGFVSKVVRLATPNNAPSTIAFDTDWGIDIANGYRLAFSTLTNFESLTPGNYVDIIDVNGLLDERYSNAPVLEMRPGSGQVARFRLVSTHSSGSSYSYLEIESQGDGLDYRIYPNTQTVAARGLQLGLSGSRLGFFGTTAIAKPTVTGAKAGNAALGSLLTQLANLGLIVDSSGA